MSSEPSTVTLTPRTEAPPDCPYCWSAVPQGPVCPVCQTRYHPDCATALGNCALLGCPGKVARSRRRLAPRRAPRKGSRWSGLVQVGLILGIVSIIAAIAIPNMRCARKHGNEVATIGALKSISQAQSLFREGDLERDGILDYGSLAELGEAGLIDDVLAGGQKQGYLFEVEPSPQTAEFLWMATASPICPTTTGDRYFVTNQEGVTYYSVDRPYPITPDCSIVDRPWLPIGR